MQRVEAWRQGKQQLIVIAESALRARTNPSTG